MLINRQKRDNIKKRKNFLYWTKIKNNHMTEHNKTTPDQMPEQEEKGTKEKYTKKEELEFYLDVKEDINAIKTVPKELHQTIALRLIGSFLGRMVINNLDKFTGIDDYRYIANCSVMDSSYSYASEDLGKFPERDRQYVVNRLLETYHLSSYNFEDLKGITIKGLREIARIDSFLNEMETITPGITDKITVRKIIGIFLESSVFERKRILFAFKQAPFLMDAFFTNRYGMKLVLAYLEFDKISKENISLLYDVKKNRGKVEPDTPEFRSLVQKRLETYKNNGKVLEALKENSVNGDAWLNYQEQTLFDLGKEDETLFAERVHLPITRLGESQEKYIKSFRESLKPYFSQLANLSIAEETDELQKDLEKLKLEQEKAVTEGNEKKAEGIQKGIDSLQNKIDNPKQVPAWDRIMGDTAMIERVMTAVSSSADALKEQEKLILRLTGAPSAENRKKLIEVKTQNFALEKKFRENLSLLETRIKDFEEKEGTLLAQLVGEEEKEKIFTVFHELALEDRNHIDADISTLQQLLKDETNETGSLEGTPMSIGVWNRNPDEDLYLGNYTDCCIRIDSEHMGEESTIADYLTDLGIQVVVSRDEKKDIPVVAAWSFIGKNLDTGETALVIDNIEANTDYSIPFQEQIREELYAYFEDYAYSIGVAKIVQGQDNNDIVIYPMDGDYQKLGGYNRKDGYFLEGEGGEDDDDID